MDKYGFDASLDEEKLERFETILELYQEEGLGYQKKASMIMDVISDFLNYRHIGD